MTDEHAPHGPIVREDEDGNVAVDLHGWGHPLPPIETPLRGLYPNTPSTAVRHEWQVPAWTPEDEANLTRRVRRAAAASGR